jgi:hypothetical protein
MLSKFASTGHQGYAKGGIFFLYFFAFVSLSTNTWPRKLGLVLTLPAQGYATFIDASSWVYAAEVWPNHNRGTGNGIAFTFIWLSIIVWTQSAPTGFANIGWKFYLVMIANAIICFIVVLVFYPEASSQADDNMRNLLSCHRPRDFPWKRSQSYLVRTSQSKTSTR